MTNYEQDLKQAALSDSNFDKANSQEIGTLYGMDPKFILSEIKANRKADTQAPDFGIPRMTLEEFEAYPKSKESRSMLKASREQLKKLK